MRPARRPEPLSFAKRRLVGARRRPAFAVAMLVLITLPATLAGAATLTSSEYAARLNRAAQGMEQAAREGKSAVPLADKALAEVPERAEVRDPSATSALRVDNRDLLAGLRRSVQRGPAGVKEAAQTLRSLQAGIAESAPAVPDGRGTLARVLARREFQKSWLQRMSERAGKAIERAVKGILNRLPSAPAGMHVPANLWRVVGYSALAAAALLVVLLVVRLVMQLTGAARPGEARLALDEGEPRRPHAEWLAEADRMLREGRYGAAVRAVYLASLMRLDETGRLSYDRARADGRFVRALEARGEGELAQHLRELSRLFSRIWYGLAPAGAEEYDRAHQLWSRLEAMTAS